TVTGGVFYPSARSLGRPEAGEDAGHDSSVRPLPALCTPSDRQSESKWLSVPCWTRQSPGLVVPGPAGALSRWNPRS
ncbi:hypothetical protein, partial [Streptomyces sp. NPDC057557]